MNRLSGNWRAGGKRSAGWCRYRKVPQGCGRAPGAGTPAGDDRSGSDGLWDGFAWVREVWVGGRHLNP